MLDKGKGACLLSIVNHYHNVLAINNHYQLLAYLTVNSVQ